MRRSDWLGVLAAAALAGSPWATAVAADAPEARSTLGALRAADVPTARAQALAWLEGVGKADGATRKAFDAVWADEGRSVLDRIAATLALGDPDAARLLADAADPSRPPPTAVPALLKDKTKPVFFRANLALAYGRALARRRVYEESLAALRAARADQVVDPAAYFFNRAVAEHALLLKKDATRSLIGLTDDVADAPDRYRMLGLLMFRDMQSWKEKDLGDIARKMDNIERRLELSRGGPQTQRMQKEVVARLDEIIKKLENAASNNSNGGACPNGGDQPAGGGGGTPMKDSRIAGRSGPGKVDNKKLRGLAEQWGKLPEKEQAQAMQDLIRDLPPRHREIIENYFKKLARTAPAQP